MHSTPKLIILRGNSGSGKSTVAKQLREVSSRKIALVEQDAIRRGILGEKEVPNGDNIPLIAQIVEFALGRGYDVILEGILNFQRYGGMLRKLSGLSTETHVYYFDISLEETLRRHATKSCAHEFGEKEMREWHRRRDFTNFIGERVINEECSLEQAVKRIVDETGL